MTTCDNTCHSFAIAGERQKKFALPAPDEVHPDSEKGKFKKDPTGKKAGFYFLGSHHPSHAPTNPHCTTKSMRCPMELVSNQILLR